MRVSVPLLLLAATTVTAIRRRLDSYEVTLSEYPDYTGSYDITGSATVAEAATGSLTLEITYSFSGLEVSTSGGMHIHVGTTCSIADLVEGHYYNSTTLDTDPWTDIEWTSDASGDASGVVNVTADVSIDDTYGHAFVVHLSDDDRAACGLIGSTEYAATLEIYPDYDGDYDITGTVAVSEDIDGEVLVNYELDGLETNTSGGIHIHAGTSCVVAAMVQGHYYNSTYTNDTDPWTTEWSSDDDGAASGYFSLDDGYNTVADNQGHSLVVHTSDTTRAACGLIGDGTEYLADLSAYPDYSGNLSISGSVVVASTYDGSAELRVTCDLSGLETSTSGGVHIHNGTSCSDANYVGGHYYNSTYTNGTDPWTDMVWESDSDGNSSTTFVVDTGYEIEDNLGRALVIHDNAGTRISCGVLESTADFSTSSGMDSTVLTIIIIVSVLLVCVMIVAIRKVFCQPAPTKEKNYKPVSKNNLEITGTKLPTYVQE